MPWYSQNVSVHLFSDFIYFRSKTSRQWINSVVWKQLTIRWILNAWLLLKISFMSSDVFFTSLLGNGQLVPGTYSIIDFTRIWKLRLEKNILINACMFVLFKGMTLVSMAKKSLNYGIHFFWWGNQGFPVIFLIMFEFQSSKSILSA